MLSAENFNKSSLILKKTYEATQHDPDHPVQSDAAVTIRILSY